MEFYTYFPLELWLVLNPSEHDAIIAFGQILCRVYRIQFGQMSKKRDFFFKFFN